MRSLPDTNVESEHLPAKRTGLSMLKSPKDLRTAAQRALEHKATKEAVSAAEREKLERLRLEFELACVSAALR
jgi:hypothetical protein